MVECPACQRRLVLKAGHVGTFKSSCIHEGCGAELLCTADARGNISVKGPGALYREESIRNQSVRASTTSRSFWASGSIMVIVLGAFGLYVVPFAFAAGGAGVGVGVLFGGVLLVGFFMALAWIRARASTKVVEPLRAVEGAFEEWKPPEGYRG